MELLRGGSDDKQSDFYTYRYLATEGFLPGYNFPRLPLVAFVSTGRGRTSGRTTIQRPRFVGISEFGPNSLVYHEGRGHRVRRVILKSGDQRADTGELATTSFYVCEECGAAHTIAMRNSSTRAGDTTGLSAFERLGAFRSSRARVAEFCALIAGSEQVSRATSAGSIELQRCSFVRQATR
jgi:hypothetical protein